MICSVCISVLIIHSFQRLDLRAVSLLELRSRALLQRQTGCVIGLAMNDVFKSLRACLETVAAEVRRRIIPSSFSDLIRLLTSAATPSEPFQQARSWTVFAILAVCSA